MGNGFLTRGCAKDTLCLEQLEQWGLGRIVCERVVSYGVQIHTRNIAPCNPEKEKFWTSRVRNDGKKGRKVMGVCRGLHSALSRTADRPAGSPPAPGTWEVAQGRRAPQRGHRWGPWPARGEEGRRPPRRGERARGRPGAGMELGRPLRTGGMGGGSGSWAMDHGSWIMGHGSWVRGPTFVWIGLHVADQCRCAHGGLHVRGSARYRPCDVRSRHCSLIFIEKSLNQRIARGEGVDKPQFICWRARKNNLAYSEQCLRGTVPGSPDRSASADDLRVPK